MKKEREREQFYIIKGILECLKSFNERSGKKKFNLIHKKQR